MITYINETLFRLVTLIQMGHTKSYAVVKLLEPQNPVSLGSLINLKSFKQFIHRTYRITVYNITIESITHAN